jgi:hypothetical protein
MPNLNQTGPEGQGQRTGRGLGQCGRSDQGERSDGKPLRLAQRRRGRCGARRRDGSGRTLDVSQGRKQTKAIGGLEQLQGDGIPRQRRNGAGSSGRRGNR